MDREELQKRILEVRYNLVSAKDKEFMDILEKLAIEALEQEPILDKIRAEIDNTLSDGMIHKKTVLGIIDKYRKEQE